MEFKKIKTLAVSGSRFSDCTAKNCEWDKA